jgi:16S rRNA (guanine966-N2)-methyltransferase
VSAPSGRAVRPTPARVKEALFSILAGRIVDARVLDLFAGTGALGFESLSRGCAHVTFVEAHRITAAALARSAHELGVADRCVILPIAAERAAARLCESYDIVFADPPYAAGYPAALLTKLRAGGAIGPETLVVYEHPSANDAPVDPAFVVRRTATYGAVALSFLEAAA